MKEYEVSQKELIVSLLSRPEEIVSSSQYVSEADFSIIEYGHLFRYLKDWQSENPDYPFDYKEAVIRFEDDASSVPQDLKNLFVEAAEGHPVPPRVLAKRLKREKVKVSGNLLLKEAADNIVDKGAPQRVLEDIMKSIEDLIEEINEAPPVTLEDSIRKVVEDMRKPKNETGRIKTPFSELTRYTDGWGRGELITVAARTSVGKSIFVLQAAVKAVEEGNRVMFFSLEMGNVELAKRLWASTKKIDIRELNPGSKAGNEEQMEAYIGSAEDVVKNFNEDLLIDSNSDVTFEYIKAKASEEKKKNGLDMIVVDYLQLMKPSGTSSSKSREREVAEISRSMKNLAKELDIPIIIVTQLKDRGTAEDGIPRMNEIRESGAVSMDSDVVILLHKGGNDDGNKDALLLLEKNRNGPKNKRIMLTVEYAQSRFEEKTFDTDVQYNSESEIFESDTEIESAESVEVDDVDDIFGSFDEDMLDSLEIFDE